MIVHISRDLFVALRGVDDLKSFKIECAAPKSEMDEIRTATHGIVTFDAEGYGWVSESWMRRASPKADNAAWQEGVGGMLSYAESKGWVDKQAGTVRAHVEWLGEDDT